MKTTSQPDKLVTLAKEAARAYSPLQLAHYGDAVYEVLVRREVLLSGVKTVSFCHKLTVEKVNASFQAKASAKIRELLTEEEADILRRGRNANISAPKSAEVAEYSAATGLEALFGYLAIIGETSRLEFLFEEINKQ